MRCTSTFPSTDFWLPVSVGGYEMLEAEFYKGLRSALEDRGCVEGMEAGRVR
jgi:hypothetical protein